MFLFVLKTDIFNQKWEVVPPLKISKKFDETDVF